MNEAYAVLNMLRVTDSDVDTSPCNIDPCVRST